MDARYCTYLKLYLDDRQIEYQVHYLQKQVRAARDCPYMDFEPSQNIFNNPAFLAIQREDCSEMHEKVDLFC